MRGNTIGARIGLLRAEKQLTQNALAEALGVKRETIFQWESNKRDLKTKAIVDLAKYFDVSCDWLLGVTDVRSRDLDVRVINEKYGLSEKALERLIAWWNDFRFHTSTPFPKFHVLNLLLESKHLNRLLNALMLFSNYSCVVEEESSDESDKFIGLDVIKAEEVLSATGYVVLKREEAAESQLFAANNAIVDIAKEISNSSWDFPRKEKSIRMERWLERNAKKE